jgi:hypothetical protein
MGRSLCRNVALNPYLVPVGQISRIGCLAGNGTCSTWCCGRNTTGRQTTGRKLHEGDPSLRAGSIRVEVEVDGSSTVGTTEGLSGIVLQYSTVMQF